jgi:hypothetical protein
MKPVPTSCCGDRPCRRHSPPYSPVKLWPRHRLEEKGDLLCAQHERQLAGLAHDRETAGKIRLVERHGEEEAQGRDRAVDARWKWRTSSAVAVSGDRQMKVANRSDLGRRVGRSSFQDFAE